MYDRSIVESYQWVYASESFTGNTHPTIKPTKLFEWIARLITPPGGVILDPFLGSGTTAVSGLTLGFDVVGCELTEEYWPIIEGRVNHALKQWYNANAQYKLFT